NNNLIINYNDKYIYAIYLLNIAINSYLNNTLNPNNHILTKLDKGMPLLYKGQIVIFKNINNTHITLGHKNKTDTTLIPIDSAYMLITYNGHLEVNSMGKTPASKTFQTKNVLSSLGFSDLKNMTGVINDSTLIILPCKDDISDLVSNIKIKDINNTYKFTELFPCSYISSTGAETDYPGNHAKQIPLLKFTTNISSAFEIIKSDKSIKNVFIIGDYPIYKHINDFERILNRKRIESVNIVTSNSNISNILDLPNIDNLNIYSWSKDVLLTYSQDFENTSTFQKLWLDKLINKNICTTSVDSNISDLIHQARKSLYYISKYDFDISIKNSLMMCSYSLLKILENTPFNLDFLEETIKLLNLNIATPSAKLENIKYLISSTSPDLELSALFDDVIVKFERIINELSDNNTKFNTLNKLVSSYKYKTFTPNTPVILLQKQYEAIILKNLLKSRNINLQVISAEKFKDSKTIKNLIMFGFYDLKYLDILNSDLIINITLYLYNSELSKYNYYMNQINSARNKIEKNNKIYNLLDIKPFKPTYETNKLEAYSTDSPISDDDSMDEYISNYKFDINLNEIILSLSINQGIYNSKKEHVTSFMISDNNEYIFCTKKAIAYSIDWDKKSVRKKKLSEAKVNDWFLFVDDYLNEEGELVINVIQKLLELNLLPSHYLDDYKLTNSWKSELKNYISYSKYNYNDVSNSLAVLGEKINPITIKNWVTNKRLIGPIYLKTFEKIFKVIDSKLDHTEVYDATKSIRSLHTKIKKSIDTFVSDNFFSSKSDIIKDEVSAVVLSMLGNTNDYVTPVQIREIHSCDKYLSPHLVNKVLDLYSVY
ncbi:DrmE family protein, partial [Clostridioides difficile]